MPIPHQTFKFAELVYACVVDGPATTVEQVAASCGLTEADAETAVRQLSTLGLLTTLPGTPQRLLAVSPTVAVTSKMAPHERALANNMRQLNELRGQMEALALVYQQSLGQGGRESELEVLPEAGAVQAVLADLGAGSREEVLTCQPGGVRQGPALRDDLVRAEELLARNVRLRAIYQHAVQFNAAATAYAERIIALGAEVRVVGGELLWMMVFDGRVAVVAHRDEPLGAVVIRDPNTVDFVVSVFEQSWAAAKPLVAGPDPQRTAAISNDVKATIVRLLAGGHSDKTIARRLGIAERTCQRHISEIFERIGAKSRFHAGYLVHQAGLVPEGNPATDP
ncbi:MAG TPA: LuxR C-terminal-related transcriptional regulator [Micromonosporaceae bacterium]|nr:LuxR C-terminal-related transcriptional regulator [Micromonosporaceae bacterium]